MFAPPGGQHFLRQPRLDRRQAAPTRALRALTTCAAITLQACAHDVDSSAHLPAGEAKVKDALGSTASLAGASRAMAAALVRAGALGAAASLAQRFVLGHGDKHKRKDRAALAARHMQEVLRAVGRPVPEVCTPCTTAAHKARWQALVC